MIIFAQIINLHTHNKEFKNHCPQYISQDQCFKVNMLIYLPQHRLNKLSHQDKGQNYFKI
jgi:hypothetical protein